MKLIKTTIYSAIITGMRLTSGFVSNKVIALYTGPAGVALVGAFTNFILIVFTFGNGAINTGVVKYTAEYHQEEQKLKILFSTAFRISIYCSAITGVFLLVFGGTLSNWVFTDVRFVNPVRILGLTIVLYSLNSLLISILNGKTELNKYTIVNSSATFTGLIFTVVLVYFYQVQGALYALVLAQSVVFFISATLVVRSPWFSIAYFNQAFDKTTARHLFRFSLMAIVTALTVPLSQIILRNRIIDGVGLNAAGYWQGMTRISDAYLMIITTSLATYYLPRLSALQTKRELRKEVIQVYKLVLPIVLVGVLSLYALRLLIIQVLYTENFMQMEDLFLWQLTGDFFKVASWILSYLMLAKAMSKTYIVTEIVFSVSYIVLGYFLMEIRGVRGITIAFAVNNFLYFLTMVFLFRDLLFKRRTADVVL